MKYPLVIVVLILFSSAPQAQKYRWNYMDIGLTADGLGNGSTFSVASYAVGNVFARANIIRNQQQTDAKPINSMFSFYTLGYQYWLIYVEAGLSQYDICWYACADYSGNVAMLGLAGGSSKLKTKISVGLQQIMNQRWTVVEADASYAFNDSIGISLGIMDLDDLGGKMTKLGIRLSW
ncbi:MAG: hypothetical protein ACPHV4_01350 [Porticoccaceae bacterium]